MAGLSWNVDLITCCATPPDTWYTTTHTLLVIVFSLGFIVTIPPVHMLSAGSGSMNINRNPTELYTTWYNTIHFHCHDKWKLNSQAQPIKCLLNEASLSISLSGHHMSGPPPPPPLQLMTVVTITLVLRLYQLRDAMWCNTDTSVKYPSGEPSSCHSPEPKLTPSFSPISQLNTALSSPTRTCHKVCYKNIFTAILLPCWQQTHSLNTNDV